MEIREGADEKLKLRDQAADWQTPITPTSGTGVRGGERNDEPMLEGQARTWPTPSGADGGRASDPGTGRDGGASLTEASGNWSTPRAADSAGVAYQRDRGTKGLERASLTGEAQTWPPPRASDHKGSVSPESLTRPDGKTRDGDTLMQAAEHYSHPDHLTANDGESSSTVIRGLLQRSPKAMRLNPMFVEWLMSFPVGWTESSPAPTSPGGGMSPDSALTATDSANGCSTRSTGSSTAEPTDSGRSAMAWSLYRLLLRSEFLRIVQAGGFE